MDVSTQTEELTNLTTITLTVIVPTRNYDEELAAQMAIVEKAKE